MTTSNPQSGLPAQKPASAVALDSFQPAKSRKSPAKKSRVRLVAGVGGIALLLAGGIWWLTHRSNPAVTTLAATLTRDPDPPIVPPPAREPLHPEPNELPPTKSNLLASMEIVGRSVAGNSDFDAAPPINERVAHWEVRFPSGSTVESYGHQLDALGIELGVIGGGETIDYGVGFSKQQPEHHSGPGADEHRAYLVWRSGALANLDAALLSRAKVATSGRLVVHFLPTHVVTDLTDAERAFAAPRNVDEVLRTAFTLAPVGDGFKFRVAEQEYFSGDIKTNVQKPAVGVKPKAETKAPSAKPK